MIYECRVSNHYPTCFEFIFSLAIFISYILWLTLFICLVQAFNWVFTLSWVDPREFDEASSGRSLGTLYQVCLFYTFFFFSPSVVSCRSMMTNSVAYLTSIFSHVTENTCKYVASSWECAEI